MPYVHLVVPHLIRASAAHLTFSRELLQFATGLADATGGEPQQLAAQLRGIGARLDATLTAELDAADAALTDYLDQDGARR
ncbi:hypothetical protein [Nocardia mexicana]|uniref:Uncharacterized protein n=1 Tax=Nocardia mexicana TaxID=279262 RepID=A0A370GNJ3_9NOCA|nr:hypothetical protein [Nocardia mexicana]RDI45305.1 hypothetical protein DFR68_11375 [Nocardia mexicana]